MRGSPTAPRAARVSSRVPSRRHNVTPASSSVATWSPLGLSVTACAVAPSKAGPAQVVVVRSHSRMVSRVPTASVLPSGE